MKEWGSLARSFGGGAGSGAAPLGEAIMAMAMAMAGVWLDWAEQGEGPCDLPQAPPL
jgi:hypothetical protein